MSIDDYDAWVRAQTAARKIVRDAQYACPMCLTPGLQPMGGGSTCWLECPCGGYSAMSPSWEAALANVEGWRDVDPGLNACMVPPVGG